MALNKHASCTRTRYNQLPRYWKNLNWKIQLHRNQWLRLKRNHLHTIPQRIRAGEIFFVLSQFLVDANKSNALHVLNHQPSWLVSETLPGASMPSGRLLITVQWSTFLQTPLRLHDTLVMLMRISRSYRTKMISELSDRFSQNSSGKSLRGYVVNSTKRTELGSQLQTNEQCTTSCNISLRR